MEKNAACSQTGGAVALAELASGDMGLAASEFVPEGKKGSGVATSREHLPPFQNMQRLRQIANRLSR